MKKVIFTSFLMAIFFALVCNGQVCSEPVATAPGAAVPPPPRVRIEVSGFPDNDKALKFITQDLVAKAQGDWEFVLTNPDCIMRIEARVSQVASWTQVDTQAVARNSRLGVGQEALRSVSYRIPRRNGIASLLIDIGQRAGQGKLESYKRQEQYSMTKWSAVVKKTFVDAKTREVISYAIGDNAITVQNLPAFDGPPRIILVQGELKGTGVPEDANLFGNVSQLVGLEAYMNAHLGLSRLVTLNDPK